MALSNFTLARPLTSYERVKDFLSLFVRNRKFQLARLNGQKLLNVGCGPNLCASFINLDWQWRPGLDLCWDVRRGLPFKDESLQGVYTEHCAEHLSYEDGLRLFRECRRVLRPGGVLRVVVPDAEMYLRAYCEGKELPCDRPDLPTRMRKVAQIFQEHGHLAAYDFDTLRHYLLEAGFRSVERAAFRVGGVPELLIDSPARERESLYADAYKT